MPAWCHISRSASTSARLRPAVAEDEGETASWAIAVPARPRVRAASAAERVRMSDPFKRPLGIHFLTAWTRSEEHTSELQSQSNLVCRLLLEKKKKNPVAYDT